MSSAEAINSKKSAKQSNTPSNRDILESNVESNLESNLDVDSTIIDSTTSSSEIILKSSKRHKLNKELPLLPDLTCHYFIKSAYKYCKFSKLVNSNYCHYHTRSENNIVCDKCNTPINLRKYKSHLYNCPIIKEELKMRNLIYYIENINFYCLHTVKSENEIYNFNVLIEKIYNISKTLPISELNIIPYSQAIPNLNINKHTLQHLHIIGQLEKLNLLNNKYLYLELGAGKAGLLSTLSHIIKSKMIAIDNCSFRSKYDIDIKKLSEFKRIKCDLQHIDLTKVSELDNNEIIIIGKHICGGALDFSLRSFNKLNNIKGVVLATCCHHRCTWETISNQQYFKELNISSTEFERIARYTSWISFDPINDTKSSSDEHEHEANIDKTIISENETSILSSSQKYEIALICKSILDYSRVIELKNCGYTSSWIQYTDRNTTLENRLLIALPSSD